MPTQLENRILMVIAESLSSRSMSPTLAEICRTLGLHSRGTVHRYVQSLVRQDLLVREGSGWRGLQLTAAGHTAVRDRLLPTLANVGNAQSLSDATQSFSIPLLGRVAAGMPIETIPDETELNLGALFHGPDIYALRVTGDSMIDAGILDGDTVILRSQKTARTGDIVVALIDAQEATLKRLGRVSAEGIELIPENSQMRVMRYAASRVSIQGVLIGQLRRY